MLQREVSTKDEYKSELTHNNFKIKNFKNNKIIVKSRFNVYFCFRVKLPLCYIKTHAIAWVFIWHEFKIDYAFSFFQSMS